MNPFIGVFFAILEGDGGVLNKLSAEHCKSASEPESSSESQNPNEGVLTDEFYGVANGHLCRADKFHCPDDRRSRADPFVLFLASPAHTILQLIALFYSYSYNLREVFNLCLLK